MKKILFSLGTARRTVISNFLRRIGAGGVILAAFLAAGTSAQKIVLYSPAWIPREPMPKRYTAEGKDVSPPLVWANLPNGTKELALTFEDLDDPRVYWLVYRIPSKAGGLSQGLPMIDVLSEPARLSGTTQGITDFRNTSPGYHGPNPTAGKKNHYRFTIYALDANLGLQPGLDKASLFTLIKDHVIGEGELDVTYQASRK